MDRNTGCCDCCGVSSDYRTLYRDFDKGTDEPRGLLCNECLNIIRFCEDDVDRLVYASLYLEKWNG